MSDSEDGARKTAGESAEQQSRYRQKLQFQASKLAERFRYGKNIKSAYKIMQRCPGAHMDAVLGCAPFNKQVITYSIDGSMRRWEFENGVLATHGCEQFDNGVFSAQEFCGKLCVVTVNGEIFVDGARRARLGVVACCFWGYSALLLCTHQGKMWVLGRYMEQIASYSQHIAQFSDRPTACCLVDNDSASDGSTISFSAVCYVGFQGGKVQRFAIAGGTFIPAEQIQLHYGFPVIALHVDARFTLFSPTIQNDCASTPFLVISAQNDKSVSLLSAQLSRTLYTLFCGETQNNLFVYQNYLVLPLQTKVKIYRLSNLLTSQCVIKSSFERPILFCYPVEQGTWIMGNSQGDLELFEVNIAQTDEELFSETL